jgi:hypothetical protein
VAFGSIRAIGDRPDGQPVGRFTLRENGLGSGVNGGRAEAIVQRDETLLPRAARRYLRMKITPY